MTRAFSFSSSFPVPFSFPPSHLLISSPPSARRPNPFYLGGRSPRYWVWAFASNQHNLAGHVADDLEKTAFFQAMCADTARGVVSVVDSDATIFSRIW